MSHLGMFALLFLVAGCISPGGDDERRGRDTFGAVLYELIEAAVDQGDCGAVRGPILRESRDTLIDDLDTVLSPDARTLVPELVKDRIRPLVISGKLPALTDTARDTLALLRDPMLDPERRISKALARLDPGDIAGHHAVSFGAEMLAEDGLEPRVHEVVQFLLSERADGRELDRVLGFAHRQLTRINALPTCPSDAAPVAPVAAGERALLSTAGFTGQQGMTMKRFGVRANAKGWPLGRAVEPFADANRDGVADTDSEGRPVDGSGKPVDIGAFGWNSPYDEFGVARNAAAEPLYRYFGIDETALWQLYRGLHAAVRDDLHDRVLTVAKAAFGTPVRCPSGGTGCQIYPDSDNAAADLAFLGFEALRSPNLEDLASGFSVLTREQKDLAETLVALSAQTGEALLDGPISITAPETLEFASAALDLFKQLETPGRATPLLGELLETLHGVHKSGVDIRKIISSSVKYSSLVKSPVCGPQDPIFAQSTPVDYSQPRHTTTGADNRSALEKGVDAFVQLDCGRVPTDPTLLLLGPQGTISEAVVNIASGLQPGQACQVVQGIKQLIALADVFSPGITRDLIARIGCSNPDAVLAALDDMDLLASTGSLDLLIPMSRVFVARNKVRSLIDAAKFMANDFAKDDFANSSSKSLVRTMMPTVLAFVDDPKSEAAFQFIDFMAENRLPDHTESIGQSTAVAVTELFETKTVKTRQGSVASTSLARQALAPYTKIAARLEGTPAKAELQALERHVLTKAFARTPGGMSLQDPNVVPLLGALSATELVDSRLTPAARTCTIDRAQGFVTGFMTSQDLPGGLALLDDLSHEQSVSKLSDWLIQTLDPNRPDGAKPATKLLLIASEVLQQNRDPADLAVASRDLEALLERDHGGIAAVLDALDTLVTSDQDRFVLPALRRLLTERAGPDKAPPYENISNLVARLASIRNADACRVDDKGLTAEDIDSALDGAINLLRRDGDALLGKIYTLLTEQR